MADAFTRLSELLFSPMGLFFIGLAIIGFIIYYFLFIRKGVIFEAKDMKQLNRDDNKAKFKMFRVKTSGKVFNGMQYIGKYNSFVHDKYSEPKMKLSNKKGMLEPAKNAKAVDFDYYTFRICKTPFIWILGMGIYYLRLDKDTFALKHNKKNIDIYIDENVRKTDFGGVWICKTGHIDTVNDPCYKYLAESTMTQIANYPNRMVFYETAHAKAVNKIKTKQEVKTKSFKEYKKAEAEDEESDSE